MNRLDPRLQASVTQRLLTREHLARWSAEAFELAQQIARAPVTFTGGFSNTQVTLGVANEHEETAMVSVPLRLGAEQISVSLDEPALDTLAGLLERGATQSSVGQTLSLDAIEAILAGLLAPLDGLSVGTAAWDTGDASGGFCALQFDDAMLPVLGSVKALKALHAAMTSKADRLVAAPLSYLKLPTRTRFAVSVEELLGVIWLNADDIANLEPGGGVVLDAVWSHGRMIAGRRFVSTEHGWRVEPSLESAPVVVRSDHAVRALDDPALTGSMKRTGTLELVHGDAVIATGRLANIERKGAMLTVFVTDQVR